MIPNKTVRHSIAASCAMLVLILDSKTAFAGAEEGIALCMHTVIPSLFPFFVVSILLTGYLPGCSMPLLRPLGRWMRLPPHGEVILLIGLLGGYPVGAQCITQTYASGALSRKNAQRMLAFCSNAGPAFIFGMGAILLKEIRICWLLWLVHILSALVVGWLTPGEDLRYDSHIWMPEVTLTKAVQKSVRVMATVCSWIVLFRIILAFFQRWCLWILPQQEAVLLGGLLELANGCVELAAIESISVRFVIFSILLGCGGLCVALQTQAILDGSGLSIFPYFLGKVTQGAVSALLSVMLLPILPGAAPAIAAVPLILISICICVCYRVFLSLNQKRDSIPVNGVV